ncbi:MAG: ADP-ribosylglycohydrolase family protein [Acidimicrobiia bacterium]
MTDLDARSGDENSGALYTVVAGEGDGFLLALAAGDTAGGAWDLGYSATTEQATIIAYELIANREIDTSRLIAAMLEMDGASDEEPVFRAESREFRMWLDRARAGNPTPGEERSLDASARAPVVGVAYRKDPSLLVEKAVEVGRLFHRDAATVAAGVISAAAVAASCFAQSGLDLITGVAETIGLGLKDISVGLDRPERLADLPEEIAALLPAVGITSGEEALQRAGGEAEDPIQMVLAGLLLAAPVAPRHHVPISYAAQIGGSRLGAVVGAIVGARVGIRAWPWAFANDTWFAEIGRRLVRGPDEVRDLPIPYAVEQHLMSGGRPGFH